MRDLSIIIPASNKNGIFVNKTIESILATKQADTEIIVVYNGAWPEPGIPDHPLVTLVHYTDKVGQRMATNTGARLAKGKYIMKLDAHCALDEGFDVKMLAEMHDDWTLIPLMKNLHAFDWVCPNGHRRYQGPTAPCTECGLDMTREILWKAKDSPKSVSYCFDSTPHFQYFGEYSKRPEAQGDVTETMSIQGSCFMLTKEKYFELNICDEKFGSWGSQGIEVACKTWLSGGRVMCNKKTWYAHMFRTQGKDFSFSHPISREQIDHAKSYARDLFFNGKWPQQKKPLSWLVEKFWPVKGWTEEDLQKLKNNTFQFAEKAEKSENDETEAIEDINSNSSGILYQAKQPKKGIIFYTDNAISLKIAHSVQRQLRTVADNKHVPIVSASLKKMTFGDKNIYFPSLKRGVLTMFKQILAALENSTADIVYFCEHDVLYHPSHFDFTPPDKSKFYYNENVWKVDATTGRALYTDHCRQVSGICAYRETALAHYKKRIALVEKNGFSMEIGYEPGTHHREARVDDSESASWKSAYPNLDIRHDNNLSPTRWQKSEFRNERNTEGWMETTIDKITGWENLKLV